MLTPFERDVQEQLKQHGVVVIPQYGASGYWIDFAAMHPDRRSEPVLAIETDGVMYHSSETARDHDRLRQQHLERLGWRFHRIWSSDWFRSREHEIERAVEAYRLAVEERDGQTPGAVDAIDEEDSPPDWLLLDSANEPTKREPWPLIPRGLSIADYTQRQLRAVVGWVKSDGRLYTEEESITEVMSALRFRRRGERILAAIKSAIRAESRQISA